MRFKQHWGGGVIRSIQQVTPTIRQFEIVPATGTIPYTAGSHVNVAVFVNDSADFRSYSLVGQYAVDGAYRIAVKQQPDSRGGSRYLWSLSTGARVELSNPRSLFELSMGRPHYLLVAGGIGITPAIGMAQRLLTASATFELIYAARHRSEVAYLPELEESLGERLRLCVSDEGTRANLSEVFSKLPAATEVYLCGPMKMLDDARRAWRDLGHPVASLRFETFGSSGRFAREEFEVAVRDLGITVIIPKDQTMIEALTAAGVKLMADCMRGECGLCLVDVLDSRGVIDHRDVFLSQQQKEEGRQRCACVSRVAGGWIAVDTGFRN